MSASAIIGPIVFSEITKSHWCYTLCDMDCWVQWTGYALYTSFCWQQNNKHRNVAFSFSSYEAGKFLLM